MRLAMQMLPVVCRAVQCFQRAISIAGQDATYLALGALHTANGDIGAAISVYCEGLEHSPENPELLTQCGLAFLRWAPRSLMWG